MLIAWTSVSQRTDLALYNSNNDQHFQAAIIMPLVLMAR